MKDHHELAMEEHERRATWMQETGGFAKDMTLRDHYAGLAMQGLLSGLLADGQDIHWDEIGRNAYWQANAMLKARDGK